MQKFDHVLLASDFDNTLVYTQSALDNGTDIPPMCPRNREALDYFIQNGGLLDRKSTRLNSSHANESRMPSSA